MRRTKRLLGGLAALALLAGAFAFHSSAATTARHTNFIADAQQQNGAGTIGHVGG